MSTQDNLERILRQMHVMLAKGESVEQSREKVIVNKREMLGLLKDLNICVYQVMDEYEMTQQSHDNAERKVKKQSEAIVKNAGKKAEDVYAASVLYTNEALNHIQRIIQNASDSMEDVFEKMKYELDERKDTVRENQLELEGQLHDLADTKKYLQMIEDRNRELEKEREKERRGQRGAKTAANRETAYPKPEIKINKNYFNENGIPLEEEKEERSAVGQQTVPEKEEPNAQEAPAIKVNLDAEYFKWRQEHPRED